MDERTGRGERNAAKGGQAAVDRSIAEGEGIVTLVCLKCGTEYYFADDEPPQGMTCEKCGNTVFRSFNSAESSEAAEDFEETTGRDLDPDDAEGDTLPGDVLDLNRD